MPAATLRAAVPPSCRAGLAVALLGAVVWCAVTTALSWSLSFSPRAEVTVVDVVETGTTRQLRGTTCPEAEVVLDTPSGTGSYRTCLGYAPYPGDRVTVAHRPAAGGGADVVRGDELPSVWSALLVGGGGGLVTLLHQWLSRLGGRRRGTPEPQRDDMAVT